MTPQIQEWMRVIRAAFLFAPGHVLEVGSFDVNGNVRDIFSDASSYIGTDMQAGPNVDRVVPNSQLGDHFGNYKFDTVMALECLEHDYDFMGTLKTLRDLTKPGGHLIITTPGFHFPYHGMQHFRDYWRFSEDAYHDIFFRGFVVMDIRKLDNAAGKGISLVGIAQKPNS